MLADGLSLEFEWPQISSSLQDFSQYSDISQLCCILDCLHSSSYFQVLKSFSRWLYIIIIIYYFWVFHILLFTFFQFYFVVSRDGRVDNFASSLFFLLIIIRSGLLAEIRWSVCMSKSRRSLCMSFSRTSAGLCIYHLLEWQNLNFCTFPSWSPCRPSCVSSYTLSVLICCIRLLCDWSFRLCHHIAYICYFVCVLSILALI